jgi:DNA-binding NtrC family response regulator
MVPDILVLDPDQKELESCRRNLTSLGYRPIAASDLETALQLLNSQRPAALLIDVALADSALELLRTAQEEPPVPLIILTGFETIERAVEGLKRGASFYLLKPIAAAQLKIALERVVPSAESSDQHQNDPQPANTSGEMIVGASHAIREVLDVGGRAAQSDANIVLFGESGTGKELFARTIHACSNRSGGPFVPVDCASLPETLLEAELFGFEKGAFTGAIRSKPGVMELAHLGTLFFDEVGELPLSLQPKLLRALQERQHRRLGGTRMVGFDVRVISATNRDLARLVSEGKFRQDLFYRLNVVPIHLPPLRQREDDAILLANHLLAEHRRRSPNAPERFAPAVLRLFEQYSWPGNVRELQNVVAYCCALARTKTISTEDLPEELQLYNPKVVEVPPLAPVQSFKLAKARCLNEFETAYMADLLSRHGDNITQAAKAAGVDRKTFYALLQKHRLRRSAIATDNTPTPSHDLGDRRQC